MAENDEFTGVFSRNELELEPFTGTPSDYESLAVVQEVLPDFAALGPDKDWSLTPGKDPLSGEMVWLPDKVADAEDGGGPNSVFIDGAVPYERVTQRQLCEFLHQAFMQLRRIVWHLRKQGLWMNVRR